MTTLSSLSARMTSSASRKALHSGRFQQFRFSGRLRMMRATPASSSPSKMSSGHSFSFFHVSDMRSSALGLLLIARETDRCPAMGRRSPLPERMQIAHQAFEPLFKHVRVNLRGGNVGVAEQRLHYAEVGAIVQK